MRNLKILAGIALIAIAGYFAWMAMMPQHQGHLQNSGQQNTGQTESGMDLRTEKPSKTGLYTVSFIPVQGEPSTGPISVWHLKVSDSTGAPVRGAKISVDGGMPAHGHGLPTSPAATGEIEPGVYAIDGIKFSMVGHWVFDVTIEAAGGTDTVRFNRVLE
ncbi:FixH family protein [Salaquimonas pukyongi]|uniref:FixH family protein n=1 Tax=Salaquimonas pukyongi TaxID=2712698 RepID=UPI00096B9FBD|nr:FixH family protein [Salaquimonas pukyongi]